MKQICLSFTFSIDKDCQGLPKRRKLSIYLIFFQVGHLFHEIINDHFTFPVLTLVLQFIQAVPWYNL